MAEYGGFPVRRVGLVGYGLAGQAFHAPVIAAVPGLALAAVASRQAGRLAADWPGVDVEPTAEAMLARGDLDLVVVATPTDTHHAIVRAALAAGQDVVVDKPFAPTWDQARDLVETARRQGRRLSVFQNRRWDGDFLTVQALLRDGRLGRPVLFESHFDRFRPQVMPRWRDRAGAGGGIWLDLGAHLVDQALQLFGRPDAIAADVDALREGAEADDYFHVQLRYLRGDRAGLRVILHGSMLAADPAPRYRLHGTLGSYVKEGVDPQEAALRAGIRPHWDRRDAWGHDTVDGRLAIADAQGALSAQPWPTARGDYLAYYAGMRDALNGVAPVPVPAEQALEVMELLALGRESAAQRRELDVPPAA